MRPNRKYGVLVLMLSVLAGIAVSDVDLRRGVTGETVITSDSLLFDYRRSFCVFEGNVKVTDPRVAISCQKLHVFFDAEHKVETLMAMEAVSVTQSNRVATCDRAVYTAGTGEIVMTGNAVLTRGRDRLAGDEIRIFVHSEKVICTPGRLVIFPADTERPTPAAPETNDVLHRQGNPL